MSDNGMTPANAERSAKQSQYQLETNRIRRYLTALDSMANPPWQGKRTRDWATSVVENLPEEILAERDPIKKLLMTQQLLDWREVLMNLPTPERFAELEAEFVEVAKAWSDRKGVGFAAWRHVRVPVEVLERAGITR